MAILKTFITLRAEDEKFSRVEKQDAIFKIHQHFFVSASPRMYALGEHQPLWLILLRMRKKWS